MSSILDPLSLPLHGHRLIEASAGTGKTYTLTGLYLRLVLGHGSQANAFTHPLLPSEILVLTFTKAATEELRERIRSRLTSAGRVFRGQVKADDALLAGLLADIPDETARQTSARRLEVAADLMDEAAIHTIHAWCQRVLREHAFDSASPFDAELVDETALREKVVQDYWRRHFYPLPARQVAEITAIWSGPETLEATLRPLLDGEQRLSPPPPRRTGSGDGEHARALIDALIADQIQALEPIKAAWRDISDVRAVLDDAIARKTLDARKLNRKNRENWLTTLEEWANSERRDKPNIGVGENRLTPDGLAELCRDGAAPPDHEAFHRLAELDDTIDSMPKLRPLLLADTINWVRQRFATEKNNRGQWAFSDLLTQLDRALADRNRGRYLAARLRKSYPVALIDEFQDTDPVQYRIFQQIYHDTTIASGHIGLFLIGDPKQAIYAFRGADVFTYLRASAETSARYTLGRNYRSAVTMVKAVNTLFGAAANTPDGPFALPGIPFVPVSANGRDEQLITCAGDAERLTLWHTGDEAARGKGNFRDVMAASCAEDIATLLDDADAGFQASNRAFRRLTAGDIAVLVPGWQEAAAVHTELARRNVKSVYLSLRDSVYQSPEAADLALCLNAVATPEDAGAVRAALATPTVGLPWAELEALRTDAARWEACVEGFQLYRELWRRRGVLPMLQRLLQDHAVPQRLLAARDGERRLTNLLQIGELLQQASTELAGEQALIRHLADARRDVRATADAQIMRLESDESLVRVITVHKSKGLEYPLVYLPFACRHHGDKPGRPLRWHNADTGEAMISLDGDTIARARAATEALAEDLRLLYVGITRAAHACRVGLTALTDYGKPVLHETAIGYLLGLDDTSTAPADLQQRLEVLAANSEGSIEVTEPPNGHSLPQPTPPAEPIAARPAARFHGHIDRRWWIGSYSALLAGAEAPDILPHPAPGEDIEVSKDPARGDSTDTNSLYAFPRGPRAGTFLHGLLEWAASIGFDRLTADPTRLARFVSDRCQRHQLAGWAQPLTTHLLALLQTPLLEGLHLAGLCREQCQPEMEFLLPAEDTGTTGIDTQLRASLWPGRPRTQLRPNRLHGMLTGYIDLVFEHQGRYYLADYKSNHLGNHVTDYTPASIEEVMLTHRYDLQYLLYSLALHRLLQTRLPGYDYNEHFGGVFYLFLRAMPDGGGVFHDCPPRQLIVDISRRLRSRHLSRNDA